MSWLKENYEKAALGGAAAVLVGVIATSVLGGGDKPSDETQSFERNDDPGSALLAEMATVLKERETDANIRPKLDGNRDVDLFVGQSLYMTADSAAPIDLYEAAPVHAGIPNEYWRKHGIDPSFANAPDRDFDKDGFTNREEFLAQTNPEDKASHPSPLSKLVASNVDVFKMRMRWSVVDANSVTIYYQDNKRASLNERVNFGDAFFAREGGSYTKRFVLGAAIVQAEGQEALSVTDTTPHYKNTPRETFNLLRRGPEPQGATEIQDRTVTLTLHALGEDGKSFEVGEYQTFSLPFDPEAKERPYKVTKIKELSGQKGAYSVEITGAFKGEQETIKLTARKN